MKSSKKATSIVEAMVVMLIIVSGVVGMYTVFNESQQLSGSTSNKIQAIQIAREGIEAMKNIRDTNWILFGSDTANCWNNDSYDPACVGTTIANNTNTDIEHDAIYRIYQDIDSRWKLVKKLTPNTLFGEVNYRTEMEVGVDNNGFYTQSGSVSSIKPLFTREIKIEYQEDGETVGFQSSNEQKMEVTSLVQWIDNSSTNPHKVEFTTILTNWK